MRVVRTAQQTRLNPEWNMSSMQSDARTLTGARRLMASLCRAGRSMLVVGVFCLALVGILHLTRGTAVQYVRGVATDGIPIGVNEPQFPLIVTMMTGARMASETALKSR